MTVTAEFIGGPLCGEVRDLTCLARFYDFPLPDTPCVMAAAGPSPDSPKPRTGRYRLTRLDTLSLRAGYRWDGEL